MKKIKEKLKQLFYDRYFITKDSYVEYEMIPGDIEGTFMFPDISYDSQIRGDAWGPIDHYKRIEEMLVLGGAERLASDTLWREKMLGGLNYWLCHDFINPNWWHNQIGTPNALSGIALMLEDYLTTDMIDKIAKILLRGSFKTDLINEENHISSLGKTEQLHLLPAQWTGANLIWGASISVKHALLTEDSLLLRVSSERLAEEIGFSVEGIQPDGAFCQHGPLWYSGGYGRSYVYEIAPLLYILSGSEYELPSEKTDIILTHILEGQRCMMRNGYFDYMSLGRAFGRKGFVECTTMKPSIALLSKCDNLNRKDEICDFAKELESNKDRYEATKFYESICQLCHKKDGVYIGVRGRSEGIFGAEKCNNEGELSYNMTYGTITCVMETGTEYYDMAPVWDYSKIPGTTAREESDETLLSHKGWSNEIKTDCKAMGRCGNNWGILSQFSAHDGISLRATYFVHGASLIALGTDIKDESPEKGKLFTTVEQCRAFDSRIINDSLAQNGNLYYKNLDENTEFTVVTEVRKGSYSRNIFYESKDIVKDTLFTITIPYSGYSSYAYSVSKVPDENVRVIRNDSECQAIAFEDGTVMAVFHEDATFKHGSESYIGKKGDIIGK